MNKLLNFMKKSQQAMEFLMTYGWAIIILIVVIGVLFSLGIFNPKIPNQCNSISPIKCYDIKLVADGTATISLTTSNTQTATLNSITINNPGSYSCNLNSNVPLDIVSTFSCDVTPSGPNMVSGNKFNGNAQITYRLEGGTVDHIVKLTFIGTVE